MRNSIYRIRHLSRIQRIRNGAGSSSFSPNLIPGFVAAFVPSVSLATGNLWQNLAKTIPATANNNPVRVLRDPWSGLEWTAPSDAARGLLKIVGGKVWIEFDGVDDRYNTSLASGTCSGDFFLASAYSLVAFQTNEMPLSVGQNSNGLRRNLWINTAYNPANAYSFNGFLADVDGNTSAVVGVVRQHSAMRSGSSVTVYVDNSSVGIGTPSLLSFVASNATIGGNVVGLECANARIYCSLIVNASLTSNNRSAVSSYLANLYYSDPIPMLWPDSTAMLWPDSTAMLWPI